MSIELAAALVALIMIIGALSIISRVTTADGLVAQATREAARAATLERSGPAAMAAAENTAGQVLTARELQCDPLDVTVDVSAFSTPPGTPGVVDVSVTCSIDLHDLPVPWVNQYTASAQASSVLDTYRERQ